MKTHRENLTGILRRKGFDFIPCEFRLCPSLEKAFREKIDPGSPNADYRDYFNMPWRDPAGVKPAPVPDGIYDKYQKSFPLANADSVEQIEEYPLPFYRDEENRDLKNSVDLIHEKDLFSIGRAVCTIWETSWGLRGMENLMIDMMTDSEIAVCLLDRVTDMAGRKIEQLVKAGVDLIYIGDDIGIQNNLMMSEELYVNWLKPRMKKIIEGIRKINPNVLIMYHSCGFITPLIPHLIDIGIDILNPVQPECMDFFEIYTQFGDKLSFTGTIGTQTTMPFGSAADVKKAVWKNLDIAGKNGGLMPAPTHVLQPEIPWENIFAYAEACREYSG